MSRILFWFGLMAAAMPAQGAEPIHILAFGDSLTAGYGLPASDSFAAQLEKHLLDRGRAVRVTNAGVSGDTTSGGRARLAWSLADTPRLVILELGANDGLRGVSPERTRANLEAMIQECRQAGAVVILAGMKAPVNWGEEYKTQFESAFADLAREYALPFYPFFLEGVMGNPDLVMEDGLHPTARGVARIVDGILPLVENELDKLSVGQS
jgi:acyl-CoA thioesterase-1